MYRKWCPNERRGWSALVAVDVGDSEKISEAAADHDSQARLDAVRRRIAALEQRLSNRNGASFSGLACVARKLLYLRANLEGCSLEMFS